MDVIEDNVVRDVAEASSAAIVSNGKANTSVSFDEMTSREFSHDVYAQIGVHEILLKDQVLTLTYRNALYFNQHLFKVNIVYFVFILILYNFMRSTG